MSLLHVDYVPLGLIDATTMSYSPHPKVELLKYVYDVRAWLTPSIEDLHGHTLNPIASSSLLMPMDMRKCFIRTGVVMDGQRMEYYY